MVIYEVNLTINNTIYHDYYHWLIRHINEMLTFRGFKQAEIAKEKCIAAHDSLQTKLTVRYVLQNEDDLNHYLDHHAKNMREAAIKQFGDQFTATRRVFIETKSIA